MSGSSTGPSTGPSAGWSGAWVARELGVDVRTTAGTGSLRVADLVGLAVRRNPRRAHLLVSRVLSKHVPADPRLVRGAGLLLGTLVGDLLTGRGGDGGAAAAGGDLLAAALRSPEDDDAADRLVELCSAAARERPRVEALVLGYAETATGLGHLVGDALDVDVLHSTRRSVGRPPAGAFEEAHSHATGHLLLPDDPGLLAGERPVVLVDDELSTGATVIDTVRSLQQVAPRERWVVATLVDLRSEADRTRMAEAAAELGVRLDVVALATGTVDLPPDVLRRGAELVARVEGTVAQQRPEPGAVAPAGPPAGPPAGRPSGGPVVEVAGRVARGFRDGGRHGFAVEHRSGTAASVPGLAAQVEDALGPELGAGGRLLVLGTEELMHVPLLVADELRRRLAPRRVVVRSSSTTRSPVLAVDDPGCAVRTALRFAAHDHPDDARDASQAARYAYNVAPGQGQDAYDAAVLVVDSASGDWDGPPSSSSEPPLPRLTDVLTAAVAGPVVVLEVPSHRPAPEPLRGPAFGSCAGEEVGWLLTDLSGAALEAPVEDRERAVQTGRAHYSESLPVERRPDAAYLALFEQALQASAARVALAVGVVTELLLAERSRPPVLVSLARGGTPVGVLVRRWAAQRGHRLEHLSASIVRGRGLDPRALDHLAQQHDPRDVVFLDGWTGKGRITTELGASVRSAEARQPRGFTPALAVLADPGSCTPVFGTREDFLVPSACLGATVSGLVSRTVVRPDLTGPGGYHGAKCYRELAAEDVTARFLDAVTARFSEVAGAVADALVERRHLDTTPTWSGLDAVERIAAELGVSADLVKPGVGETTRVLLRRVPWKVLVRPDALPQLAHVLHLAAERGAAVEERPDLPYACVGVIRPAR